MSPACPVFGFVVEYRISPGLDEAADAALRRSFIDDAIELRGLVSGGRRLGVQWSHVVHSEAGQATDADREAILAWSRTRPEIASITVGLLADLGHDD